MAATLGISAVFVAVPALYTTVKLVGAGRVWLQSLTLGGIQITIALFVNAMIVLAAGSIAAFLTTRPGWLRVQRYLMGSVLGLLAIKLATDRALPVSA